MKYETIIRCKWLGEGATTLAEIAERLRAEADHLQEMHDAGLTLAGPMEDDYAFVGTDDAELAARFDIPENEDEDDECEGGDIG